MRPAKSFRNSSFPIAGGLLFGAGVASFVHSVLLGRMFDWHRTASLWYPPDGVVNDKINMIWDGLFQIVTYLLLAGGLTMLWRSGHEYDRWSYVCLTGTLLSGAGLFALTEGLICHEILAIHHINALVPADQQFMWDIGYLGIGGGLLALGIMLLNSCHSGEEVVQ